MPLLHDPMPRAGASFGPLYGHLAGANPQWKHFRPEIEALLIFQDTNASRTGSPQARRWKKRFPI